MSDWRTRGLCRTHEDPNLWHPAGKDGGAVQAVTAQRVCWGCPVRAECARWALEQPEKWGVWGGLDAAERARLLGVKPPHDYDTTATPADRLNTEPEHGTYNGAKAHRRAGEELCGPCLEARREYKREQSRAARARQKAEAAA